jgi:hypothetical protein
MSKSVAHALRDLILLVIGAVLPVISATAATKGLFHLSSDDLEGAAGAALTGIVAWVAIYVTPLTRKYGVGYPGPDGPAPPVLNPALPTQVQVPVGANPSHWTDGLPR